MGIELNQSRCSYHECQDNLEEQDEIYVEKHRDDMAFNSSLEYYHNAYCSRNCRRNQKRENEKIGAKVQQPITEYTISTSNVNFS